jgi:hypothetical protein
LRTSDGVERELPKSLFTSDDSRTVSILGVNANGDIVGSNDIAIANNLNDSELFLLRRGEAHAEVIGHRRTAFDILLNDLGETLIIDSKGYQTRSLSLKFSTRGDDPTTVFFKKRFRGKVRWETTFTPQFDNLGNFLFEASASENRRTGIIDEETIVSCSGNTHTKTVRCRRAFKSFGHLKDPVVADFLDGKVLYQTPHRIVIERKSLGLDPTIIQAPNGSQISGPMSFNSEETVSLLLEFESNGQEPYILFGGTKSFKKVSCSLRGESLTNTNMVLYPQDSGHFLLEYSVFQPNDVLVTQIFELIPTSEETGEGSCQLT